MKLRILYETVNVKTGVGVVHKYGTRLSTRYNKYTRRVDVHHVQVRRTTLLMMWVATSQHRTEHDRNQTFTSTMFSPVPFLLFISPPFLSPPLFLPLRNGPKIQLRDLAKRSDSSMQRAKTTSPDTNAFLVYLEPRKRVQWLPMSSYFC